MVAKMTKPDILVLYGSETGTAQDFAYSLAHRIRYLKLNPLVCSMDSLDLELLFEVNTLLLVCSTTGQGQLPKNCRKFFRFLMQKKLPPDFFEHLKFSTCGLGDSSYVMYNLAARKLHARLRQLGAFELCPRVECDEQSPQGQEAFYETWEKVVFDVLKKRYADKISVIPSDTVLSPVRKLKVLENREELKIENIPSIERTDPQNKLIKIKLNKIERITDESHFQEVVHVTLGNSETPLKYKVGDCVSFYPENDPKDVQSFINLQGWNDIADKPLQLDIPPQMDPDGGWVKNMTLRSLLTYHLDIMAVPPRTFFQTSWHFASDKRESEKLQELGKYSESEQLYNYANRPHRSILEVVQEFFSLKIPLDQVLEIIPLIRPRQYSICNIPNSSTVELAVAIVEYSTIIRRVRKGLCTSWLKRLKTSDTIIVSLSLNELKIPRSDMILVGPGTGIAPIRSIIQQNDINHSKGNDGHEYLLFTGHRNREKDYLFGEEWPKMKGLKVIDSFSRQGGGYVQDTIWKNKEIVGQMLKRGAGVYLCGSSGKMPTQVRLTIQHVLQEIYDWDLEQVKAELLKMEKQGRFIQETW